MIFGLVGALARLSLQCTRRHRRPPTPPGYPQTPHTMYARFHSSEGPWKPKSVSQSHSRFSRRLGGTYSGLASRGSSHRTHGSHLRLAEVPPRELEHFTHRIGRVHQQIGLTCPLHVSRSFRRSSGAPSKVDIWRFGLSLSTAAENL